MLFVPLIEYLGGRFAGRELLLKALSKIKIREKDINKADDWIAIIYIGIRTVLVYNFFSKMYYFRDNFNRYVYSSERMQLT